MKEIFTAFQARVASNVTAIKFTDFDLGQLDLPNPPVSFPCALLSFTGSTASVVGAENDEETMVVEIAIAFRLRERTHSAAQQTYRDEALTHMDTVELVRQALSGLSGTTFTALRYKGFTLDRRADLRVYRQRYEVSSYPEPASAGDPQYVPWPNPTGPDFCVHPDINTNGV
ncbi:MAG: hypothetical protein LCH81_00980 [Bacteroidetes bacterium]|nr:hypothetical protein [Bacteroidota bacterium]